MELLRVAFKRHRIRLILLSLCKSFTSAIACMLTRCETFVDRGLRRRRFSTRFPSSSLRFSPLIVYEQVALSMTNTEANVQNKRALCVDLISLRRNIKLLGSLSHVTLSSAANNTVEAVQTKRNFATIYKRHMHRQHGCMEMERISSFLLPNHL